MPEDLWGPVLVATCVWAAIGCFLTGLLANAPFAQAPGMGLNAFFTYTVCLGMGYTWQEGLAIDQVMEKELQTTTPDAMVSDIMPMAAEAVYPIAVVDSDGQFKGIVTKASVLSSLI